MKNFLFESTSYNLLIHVHTMSLNEFMMIAIQICISSNTKIILEGNQLRQKYKINNTHLTKIIRIEIIYSLQSRSQSQL